MYKEDGQQYQSSFHGRRRTRIDNSVGPSLSHAASIHASPAVSCTSWSTSAPGISGPAFLPNLAAIQLLKEYMADEIGVADGEIIASSKGLHLYEYSWELAKTVGPG